LSATDARLLAGSSVRAISILSLGSVDARSIETLAKFFPLIEQIDSGLGPDALLTDHAAALNRAIDGASGNWILILRGRETIDPSLAGELASAVSEPPLAWGYRIASVAVYCGRALRFGRDKGEIRLFQRRHARFDLRAPGREMKVQGTVIRIMHPLRMITFESAADHQRHLAERGVPHSLLRRLLLFSRNAIVTGSLWRSATSLRYLWIEAGYDSGRSQEPGAGRQ